ncbi:MAG: hypothetical protein ISR65_13545 [Bacteriovoracaceae bacterium]|nr:hypothetical protein [Bacteriovoracaceae bacterium]
MKFLTFLISFSLLVTPIQNIKACEYPNDQAMAQAKTQCESTKTGRWDCQSNRCLTTQDVVELREDYQQCAAIEDQNEKKKCHEDFAKSEAGDLTEYEPTSGLSQGVYALTVALATINFFSKKATGSCMSKTLFNVAAVSSLLSEAYFFFFLSKKLKKLEEGYEYSEDPYQAQLSAFKYLKTEQETIATVAKQKANAYYVQAALYGAAMAMALYEMFTSSTCAGTSKKKDILPPLIPKAYAEKEVKKDYGLYLMLIGAAGGALLSKMGGGEIIQFFNSSQGIAIISGIAAFISFKLAAHNKKVAKEASANADRIQEIIDNFMESMIAYCPGGRDTLNEPRCYCYTEEGTRNENRTNSGTCQALWASEDTNLFVDATEYTGVAKAERLGCLNINQEFDPDCKCRRFKDAGTGQNACYKTPDLSTTVGSFGNSLGVSTLATNVDSMAQGDYASGTLSSARPANQAAKNMKMAKKLLKEANKKMDKPLIIDGKLASKMVDKIATPTLLKKAKSGLLHGGSALTTNPPSEKKLGKSLKEVLKKYNDQASKKAKYEESGGAATTDKKGFEFDFQGGARPGTKGKTIEFMKKNYDMGDSDINKNEDSSIWKVITNRFNISGLRRLFGGDPNATQP